MLSSSAEAIQSWSDGEYSYSNIARGSILGKLLDGDLSSFDIYFKKRLAIPVRSSFGDIAIRVW